METKAILKKVNTANKKLAELKGIIKTIPNEKILINFIFLQEAKDSSAVENIITTHDELYKQFIFDDTHNIAAKEVENYVEALYAGYDIIKKKGGMQYVYQICGRYSETPSADADTGPVR